MELLKNKVAIVTGGSHGLGKTIALKFASHGASLILVATNKGGSFYITGETIDINGGTLMD